MFTRDDVAGASANRLVPLYLIASYAYYHRNASVMPDDAYDLCCTRLDAEFFFVDHPHAHLIDKEGLSATTAFKLREADYPLIVKVAATSIINERDQQPMSNEITLVQIQGGIGMPLTADYIENKLGVTPTRSDKRAKFWTKDQFVTICDAVIKQAEAAKSVNLDGVTATRPKKEKAEPETKVTGGFFGNENPAPAAAPAAVPTTPAAGGFFDAAPAPAPASSNTGGFFQ